MAKVRALGTAVTFGGTAITGLTTIGEVSPKAEELDSTTLDSASGYKEFIQGFKDAGELALTGYHNKTDAGQTAIRAAFTTGTSTAVVITFPDTPATTVSFNAWVKGYSVGAADVAGIVGFGATLRISGAVTVA